MELWIARDADGWLGMYEMRPDRDEDAEEFVPGGGFLKALDERLFPEVSPGACKKAVIWIVQE